MVVLKEPHPINLVGGTEIELLTFNLYDRRSQAELSANDFLNLLLNPARPIRLKQKKEYCVRFGGGMINAFNFNGTQGLAL